MKRNIERFPKDFMFRLTEDEFQEILKFQFGTSSSHGGRRYLPYVFTEQGVYMLATVLKGEVATHQSILIMRTFREMRHYIAENRQIINDSYLLDMSVMLLKHEEAIHRIESTMVTRNSIKEIKKEIQNIMDNFIVNDKVKEFAFLKGEQFEADELFIKIYKEAKQNIYIIDDYVSIRTLSHLKHKDKNVNVIIFTKNRGGKDKLRKAEIDDFNSQYSTLVLKDNNQSHDRYIIIDYKTDNERIYHSGASIKDAGKKACLVNEINDRFICYPLIDRLLTGKNLLL